MERSGIHIASRAALVVLCSFCLVAYADAPPSVVQAARRTQDLIKSVRIERIEPLPLTADGIFVIQLQVELTAPRKLAETERDLRIQVDGQTVEEPQDLNGASRQSATTSSERPAPRASELPSLAQTVTLIRKAPPKISSSQSLVTIRDAVDGQTLTHATVSSVLPQSAATVLPAPAQLTVGENLVGWKELLSASVALLALFASGFALYRERRRSVELQRGLEQALYSRAKQAPAIDQPANGTSNAAASDDLPSDLIEAFSERRVALIIGSGVSAEAGVPLGYQLWQLLVDRLAANCAPDTEQSKLVAELRTQLGHTARFEIIEATTSAFGRQAVVKELATIFSGNPRSTRLHAALTALNCPVIVDMTWDPSTPRLVGSGPVFTPSTSEGLLQSLRGQDKLLLKPFGLLTDWETFALTPQDLRLSLSRNEEFQLALSSVCTSSNLLFVGMSSEAISEFISVLPPHVSLSNRKNAAIAPSGEFTRIWQLSTGEAHGVQVVAFPRDQVFKQTEIIERARQKSLAIRKAVGTTTPRSLRTAKLQQVVLENIGVFKTATIQFEQQWTGLLGENGCGKSTVLRAIALALSGTDSRASVAARTILRADSQRGQIDLVFSDNDKLSVELVRTASGVSVRSTLSPLQAGQMLALGFPVIRGISTDSVQGPSLMAAADPSVEDISALLLAQPDSRLDKMKQWIVNSFASAEGHSTSDVKMLDTIKAIFAEMLPGGATLSHVDKDRWTVMVRTTDSLVELDSISQGMSAVLNWVGVLVHRMHDVYPNSSAPELEYALVLLDEIDVHLHPKWQRKLMELVRTRFPNVQAIVTTHSALIAGSLSQDELRIVERDREGDVVVRRSKLNLEGHRAEDILTSDLFDLPTSRSPEAERLIKRYFHLYERPMASLSDADSAELKRLKSSMDRLSYGSMQPAWIAAMEEPRLADSKAFADGLSDEAILKVAQTIELLKADKGDGGAR